MKQVNLEKLLKIAGDEALSLEEELHNLALLVKRNFELEIFLENRMISKNEKKKFFKDIFPAASKLMKDFFDLIIEEDLEKYFVELAGAYSKLVSTKLKVNLVDAISAFPLDKNERKMIQELVGEKVSVRVEIDPSLIGGFKLRVGDGRFLDASLSGKLKKLKEDLVNA